MTGVLAPSPLFQSFTANGTLNAFGTLATYAAGTSTPQATYTDATLTTPNQNPITLNPLGQAAVWLNPGLAYKFVWFDQFGNQLGSCDQVYGPFTAANLTASYLGSIIYPQTLAESSVANFAYPTLPFSDVRRYGCKCDGVTDDTAALQVAFNVTATNGLALVLPYGYTLKITSYVQVFSNTTFYIFGKLQLTARASGLYANGASNISIIGNSIGQIQDSTVFAGYTWNSGGQLAPSIHLRSCTGCVVDGINESYVSQGVLISNATTNTSTGAAWTLTQAFSNNCIIRNCYVTFTEWSAYSCINMNGGGYFNNYCYRNGDSKIWFMGVSWGRMINNRAISPASVPADVATYGQNNQAHPTTWNDEEGMSFQSCFDVIVQGNSVENMWSTGIDVKDNCNRVLVTGNNVYNCENSSICIRDGDSGNQAACNKITVSNNTITNHGTLQFNTATSYQGAILFKGVFMSEALNNVIYAYQTTPGIACYGPGAYQGGEFSANPHQASLSVCGNSFDFGSSASEGETEIQFTSSTQWAIVINGQYDSITCNNNHIRTDRYIASDTRYNSDPAIALTYVNANSTYYPTSATISGNNVQGWGTHGISVAGLVAMTGSGLTVNGNSIGAPAGTGIVLTATQYAICSNNTINQPGSGAGNPGISISGSSGNVLSGVVATGNVIIGGWNTGANATTYGISVNYVADINLENTRCSNEVTGVFSVTNATGNVFVAGSSGFPRSGAATPNAAVTSYYQGEIYFNTAGPTWYMANSYQSTSWFTL